MEIKVEVTEGNKTTSYILNTRPTEEAVGKAVEVLARDIKSWLRETFTKETRETIV